MKEKVLEAFSDLGFKLEEEEGMCYSFSYEGMNLLYMPGENDEDFLSIALPGIFEFEEGKVLQICALMEKINSTLKYVKAYILGNNVWMFYERELFGGEELAPLISRMIYHLESGLAFARRTMAEIEEADEDGTAEEVHSEDDESVEDDDRTEE